MAVTCSNGHTNLDGMAFCEECGVELTTLTDRPAAVDPPGDASPSPIAQVSPIDSGTAPTVATEEAAPPASGLGQNLVPGELPAAPTAIPGDHPAGVASPAAGHAYLEVVAGQFAGRRFQITEPTCTLGRWDMDSGAFPEIDLTEVDVDAKVSRKHVRISKEVDHYVVEDLGSLNGTSLNRAPRLLPGDRQVLRPNDELIVGRLFLKFVIA
jgi:hypothetical protein